MRSRRGGAELAVFGQDVTRLRTRRCYAYSSSSWS